MSRRRRTNRRRKRKSRSTSKRRKRLSKVLAAAKFRKVVLDRRKKQSPPKIQSFAVIVAPAMSNTTPDKTTKINVLRVGPRSRLHVQNSDTPTSASDGNNESRQIEQSNAQTSRDTGHAFDSEDEQAGAPAMHVGVV